MKTQYNTSFLINTLLGTSLVIGGCKKLHNTAGTDLSKVLAVVMLVIGSSILYKQPITLAISK